MAPALCWKCAARLEHGLLEFRDDALEHVVTKERTSVSAAHEELEAQWRAAVERDCEQEIVAGDDHRTGT